MAAVGGPEHLVLAKGLGSGIGGGEGGDLFLEQLTMTPIFILRELIFDVANDAVAAELLGNGNHAEGGGSLVFHVGVLGAKHAVLGLAGR